jgi:hypothetical protein
VLRGPQRAASPTHSAMPCIFTSPGCSGPGTTPNECAFCHVIAQDADLQMMATIFPLEEVRRIVQPRVAAATRQAQMPPVPMQAGKHVNKGAVAGPTFQLSALTRSAGDQNCALCSCAGAVNLALGYVKLTTKKVAKLHGVEDGYKALGARAEQEQAIIRFVAAQLPGYHHVVHGSDANRIDLPSAIAAMKSYPDETVFVVSTTGGISKGGVELSKASWGHWLNAVKKNGDIVFVDFQTDHEQRLGRGFVSTEPILGNFGVEWDNPRMQVIAFVPPPPLPPQPLALPVTNVAATLPTPVMANVSTQQLLPLNAPPTFQLTARQQRGRAVNFGSGQQLDDKLKRQAHVFGYRQ